MYTEIYINFYIYGYVSKITTASKYIHDSVFVFAHYEVAVMSRLLKNICLFFKRAL